MARPVMHMMVGLGIIGAEEEGEVMATGALMLFPLPGALLAEMVVAGQLAILQVLRNIMVVVAVVVPGYFIVDMLEQEEREAVAVGVEKTGL